MKTLIGAQQHNDPVSWNNRIGLNYTTSLQTHDDIGIRNSLRRWNMLGNVIKVTVLLASLFHIAETADSH